eukprot:5117972-Prymnesium_polylepis.1
MRLSPKPAAATLSSRAASRLKLRLPSSMRPASAVARAARRLSGDGERAARGQREGSERAAE